MSIDSLKPLFFLKDSKPNEIMPLSLRSLKYTQMFRNVHAISDYFQPKNFTTSSSFLEVFTIPFKHWTAPGKGDPLLLTSVLEALLWSYLWVRNPGAMGFIHLESRPQLLPSNLPAGYPGTCPCKALILLPELALKASPFKVDFSPQLEIPQPEEGPRALIWRRRALMEHGLAGSQGHVSMRTLAEQDWCWGRKRSPRQSGQLSLLCPVQHRPPKTQRILP